MRESHYMDFLEPVSSERGRQSGREEIFEAKQLKSLSWTYVFFPSADQSQIAIIKWGLFRVGLAAFTQNPTLRQKVSAVGVSMSSQTRLHPLKFAASYCCSVATGSVAENQKDLGRNPAGTRPSLQKWAQRSWVTTCACTLVSLARKTSDRPVGTFSSRCSGGGLRLGAPAVVTSWVRPPGVGGCWWWSRQAYRHKPACVHV